MIALIQRVNSAHVSVKKEIIGQIAQGILAFIGIEREDNEIIADKLLLRILNYRIFADNADKMNLSLKDIQGSLLLVPQFTLVANTNKGSRPSFSSVTTPKISEKLFNYMLIQAENIYKNKIASGRFGTDMQVNLTNDGPVTFWLQIK
jgi:D-tyrosyl-tRNA(Tyr) deacylase